MSAADVAYVVAWEAQTVSRWTWRQTASCVVPRRRAAAESNAKCTGSITENGTTYTMPGKLLTRRLPTTKASSTRYSRTRRLQLDHAHLEPRVPRLRHLATASLPSATAATGGTLAAGTYDYEITAATAYGESEPSVARQ